MRSRRRLDGDAADDERGVARAHLRRVDADRDAGPGALAGRAALGRRRRSDQLPPERRGELARHAEVRHGVDAVGRDLEVEDRVVAVLLDRLDGVADLREAARRARRR